MMTGKEELIALANGEEVQIKCVKDDEWYDSTLWTVGELLRWQGEFRLKPRTITINNIEVPAPFKPKHGDVFWYLDLTQICSYSYRQEWLDSDEYTQLGAWRNEEEIRQVVAALRSIFK